MFGALRKGVRSLATTIKKLNPDAGSNCAISHNVGKTGCGSGIGKSSVANELHKVLVRRRALFASGKFDPYKRDILYATLSQALQGPVRSLLAQSEGSLAGWRDALRATLGADSSW